jgi:hypothetical protein
MLRVNSSKRRRNSGQAGGQFYAMKQFKILQTAQLRAQLVTGAESILSWIAADMLSRENWLPGNSS